MNKTILLAIATLVALSGCTTIKDSTIESATFNSSGWKSNAGIQGNATIDATNDLKPNTNLSPGSQ